MPSPPIIIKKTVIHGGHHGGAWKVAYADFVTAMMALFIVLWLMNTSKPVKEAISGYFKDPSGTGAKTGTSHDGTSESLQVTKQNMAQLKEELQKSIQKINDLEKLRKNIEMTVTAEGLRIELLESEKGTFFESGSAEVNASGKQLLELLAQQLADLPNHISVEGHTDAKPYSANGIYSNWELSTDRANAARRIMEQTGLKPGHVSQVRGFADQRLRTPDNPFEASNRRISIIVQYLPRTPNELDGAEESASEPKEGDAERNQGETKPKE